MTTLPELAVHTVFAANGAEGNAASLRRRILGLVTLLAAAGWLYVAWRPMYRWIHEVLLTVQVGAIMELTGGFQDPTPEQIAELQGPAQVRAICAYGWLALVSLAGSMMILAGTAALTVTPRVRRIGAWATPAVCLAAGLIAWYLWKKYNWYETAMPAWAKPGVAVLIAVAAAALGAACNRRGVGLLRAAAITIIVSAALTVVIMWVSIRWGQMPPLELRFYAQVFAVQSAYGWLLLPATIRLR